MEIQKLQSQLANARNNMKNKKGFAGMMASIIVAVAVIVALIFWWKKMSGNKLQNATQKAANEAGIQLENHDATPQGQIDAVRDMTNKLQDKKNSEIENELNK